MKKSVCGVLAALAFLSSVSVAVSRGRPVELPIPCEVMPVPTPYCPDVGANPMPMPR